MTQLNSTQLNSTQLNSTQLNSKLFRHIISLLSLFYFSNTFAQCPDVKITDPLTDFRLCIADFSNAELRKFKLTDESTIKAAKYIIDWGDTTTLGAKTKIDTLIDFSLNEHIFDVNGTFTITVTGFSKNGCSNTFSHLVKVESSPIAKLEGPKPGSNVGCAPFKLDFVNTSVNVSPTTRVYFDAGDGTPIRRLKDGSTNETITHTYKKGTCNNKIRKLGGYTATLITVSECDSTISTYFPVKIYDKPFANFTFSLDSCKDRQPIVFSNISTPNGCAAVAKTTYTWDFGDGTPLITKVINDITKDSLAVQEIVSHTFSDTGTYMVSLKAENISLNGCGFTTKTSAVKIVNCLTDIYDRSMIQNVLISPNPSKGIIDVKVDAYATIQVISITGKVLREENVKSNTSFDLTQENKGLYFLKIQTDKSSIIKKIIIE